MDDFDPVDRPPETNPAGNPLLDYLQPPPGLALLGTSQFAIAGLFVLLGISAIRQGQPLGIGVIVSVLGPVLLLCAAGVGMLLRVGWGWWLTAAIYYTVFFNLPVNLILWTTRGQPFSAANLVTFGLAVVVLAYITRKEFLRFIRFQSADGRPTPRTLLTPIIAGILWSCVSLTISLLRRGT